MIVGGVLALVFVIYTLVDVMVTDERRIRSLNRILWVVLVAVLPVVGGVAWWLWGKGPRSMAPPIAPDDDPRFTGSVRAPDPETDERIRQLEAELAALDDEDFAARFDQIADAASTGPAPSDASGDEPHPQRSTDTPDDDDSGDASNGSQDDASHRGKPGE